MDMKTIFVSIASYRDADIQNTIDNLLMTANHPERVYIGVYLQFDSDLDRDCTVRVQPRVSIMSIDATDATGAGSARSQAQKMYNNEDFFFQVDSHMRFAMNWDTKLIEMHERASDMGQKNVVISTYPLPFTPPNAYNEPRYVVIKPKAFDVDGVMLQNSGMFPLNNQDLIKNPFISAGMLFSSGSIVKDVPYDPHIPFTGEEIALGLRLFTHGYDVYIPNQVVAYHNYNMAPERPRIWKDQKNHDKRSYNGRTRVKWLCGQEYEEVSTEVLIEIDKYGLGNKRSLAQFEFFSKINFHEREWCGKKTWA
jgi:hypothetical protein